MLFPDILAVINDPGNIVLKVATVSNDGLENVKYVLCTPYGRQIMAIWGCDTMEKLPKWVMSYVVIDDQVQDLTDKQKLVLFKKISYKYKQSEIQAQVYRHDKRIR